MSNAMLQISKALNKSKKSNQELANDANVAINTILNIKKGVNVNPVLCKAEAVAKAVGLKIVAVKV
jgi:DNA-binding XRE family transcriptional regulator